MKDIWLVYFSETTQIDAIFEKFEDAKNYAETRSGAKNVQKTNYHPMFTMYANNFYDLKSVELFENVEEAVECRNEAMRQIALNKLTKEEQNLLGLNT